MLFKYLLIILVVISFSNTEAVTIKLGIWGGSDSRDQIEGSAIYGFTAALLWGKPGSFQYGVGGHKALQRVNTLLVGYEALTFNLQFGGFYLNPFYGYRAVRVSDYFESNNLYPTQGAVFGYDYFISKSFSIGVMGVYENPGELASDKTNANYVKLEPITSPAITFRYWWH